MSDTLKSVGELRAEKSRKAEDWTPAELFAALQRDAGKIKFCVVSYVDQDNNVNYWAAGEQSKLQSIGLVETTNAMLCMPSDD